MSNKFAEYAAKHANDGKTIDVETMVSAQTMVNEIIEIKDIARIEKTKYGNPAYMIKISDDTGFFSTSSITRQIDKMLADGFQLSDFVGSRWVVIKKHIDEKNGKAACDFLKLEFVEDADSDSDEE